MAAGAAAARVPLSGWFLLVTFFLALCIGFGKRRHDLMLREEDGERRPVLERYSVRLLDILIGISAAMVIAAYTLYTIAPETVARFGSMILLVTVPLVVYGVSRYLFLAYKKEDGGDPADLVFRDPGLIASVALWLLVVIVILTLNHFHMLGGG